MKNIQLKKLVLSALFTAVGLVLPFLTGQLPQIGKMLLPMHIPVMLCGLICGPFFGFAVGFLTPLIRTALFGMPVLFPTAVAMAFELAVYGAVSGVLYRNRRIFSAIAVYRAIILAMLSGRIVWGIVMCVLLGVGSGGFTLGAFFSTAFATALPGIALQLILIPGVMLLLDKKGLFSYEE